jgi:hypothetical protein
MAFGKNINHLQRIGLWLSKLFCILLTQTGEIYMPYGNRPTNRRMNSGRRPANPGRRPVRGGVGAPRSANPRRPMNRGMGGPGPMGMNFINRGAARRQAGATRPMNRPMGGPGLNQGSFGGGRPRPMGNNNAPSPMGNRGGRQGAGPRGPVRGQKGATGRGSTRRY